MSSLYSCTNNCVTNYKDILLILDDVLSKKEEEDEGKDIFFRINTLIVVILKFIWSDRWL